VARDLGAATSQAIHAGRRRPYDPIGAGCPSQLESVVVPLSRSEGAYGGSRRAGGTATHLVQQRHTPVCLSGQSGQGRRPSEQQVPHSSPSVGAWACPTVQPAEGCRSPVLNHPIRLASRQAWWSTDSRMTGCTPGEWGVKQGGSHRGMRAWQNRSAVIVSRFCTTWRGCRLDAGATGQTIAVRLWTSSPQHRSCTGSVAAPSLAWPRGVLLRHRPCSACLAARSAQPRGAWARTDQLCSGLAAPVWGARPPALRPPSPR
jgi:hypothetical protein